MHRLAVPKLFAPTHLQAEIAAEQVWQRTEDICVCEWARGGGGGAECKESRAVALVAGEACFSAGIGRAGSGGRPGRVRAGLSTL